MTSSSRETCIFQGQTSPLHHYVSFYFFSNVFPSFIYFFFWVIASYHTLIKNAQHINNRCSRLYWPAPRRTSPLRTTIQPHPDRHYSSSRSLKSQTLQKRPIYPSRSLRSHLTLKPHWKLPPPRCNLCLPRNHVLRLRSQLRARDACEPHRNSYPPRSPPQGPETSNTAATSHLRIISSRLRPTFTRYHRRERHADAGRQLRGSEVDLWDADQWLHPQGFSQWFLLALPDD